MESESAFIWSDGIVELYSISTVYLDVVVIVLPFDFECNDSIRLCNAVKNLVLEIQRV